MGQHVQQHLGIRIRAQVTPVFANQKVRKLVIICQIAVVRETDSVRRIHIERLGFRGLGAASRWVTHMTDANIALQPHHVPAAKYIANQANAFALLEPASVAPCHNAGGILATVLQYGQGVVQSLVDWLRTYNSDHAAHSSSLQFYRQIDGQLVRDFVRNY